MPKPITPLVGCGVFLSDVEERVLLIRRADSGFWGLPGGFQDLGETPAECAVRECREETGLEIELIRILGVFSSMRYEFVNYPWKENEFTHVLFQGQIFGGELTRSAESTDFGWFTASELPELSDGHDKRIQRGFEVLKDPQLPAFFE